MTLSRGFALCLTLAAAGALLNASDPAETGVGRLKTISARTNGKGAQLVIEANTPLAYVATRPDPLTVVLDFRNVEAGSVANSVKADAKSPIASVSIEGGESLTIDLLYGDLEGGQRIVSRFVLDLRQEGGTYIASVGRHWNIDQPDPR